MNKSILFSFLIIIFFLIAPSPHAPPSFNIGRTTHHSDDGATSIEDTIRGTYIIYDKTTIAIAYNMSAYIKVTDSNHKIRLCIYNSNTTHHANNLIGMTEERTIHAGNQGWTTFNFS